MCEKGKSVCERKERACVCEIVCERRVCEKSVCVWECVYERGKSVKVCGRAVKRVCVREDCVRVCGRMCVRVYV